MTHQRLSSLILLTAALQIGAVTTRSQAVEPAGPSTYQLGTIIEMALARNPVVSSAEGDIEHQRGQQTAAGAYPNPTVMGNAGYGEIRDTGRDRKSVV